jgi:hypothetical protein
MKRRNLISKTVIFLYLVLTFVFTSCAHVKIEEYTTVESYCTDTWYVGTRVWVVDWKGFSKSLELWEQDVVEYEKIDSVRALHRIKANKCAKKVEACLGHAR